MKNKPKRCLFCNREVKDKSSLIRICEYCKRMYGGELAVHHYSILGRYVIDEHYGTEEVNKIIKGD